MYWLLNTRGGVEDTRLEALDTKKVLGQGQTLSRPRIQVQVFSKKRSSKFFSGDLKKKKKNFLSDIQTRKTKRSSQIFREISGVFLRNCNASKHSVVRAIFEDLRLQGFDPRGLHFYSILLILSFVLEFVEDLQFFFYLGIILWNKYKITFGRKCRKFRFPIRNSNGPFNRISSSQTGLINFALLWFNLCSNAKCALCKVQL